MQTISQITALHLVGCIASGGVLLSSFEYLTTRSLLNNTGLLSWPVHRLRHKFLAHGPLAVGLNAALAYPNVLVLLGIQSGLAILLLIGSMLGFLSALTACLLTLGIDLTLLLFAARSSSGREGSDQMLVIIFATLVLAYAFNTAIIFAACLWFLAIESCLSYAAAGIAKFLSPIWRSGQALPMVMATAQHGHHAFFIWLNAHPRAAKLLTWGTIGFESLFPLILLIPWIFTLIFLMCGFVFHLSNAIFMRLNRFVWAFTATYPAIWYCVNTIHLWR